MSLHEPDAEILIGTTYSTFLARRAGELVLLKSQDVHPPDREAVIGYREFLAHQLAVHVGLAVPKVALVEDQVLGRCSAHRWIANARQIDPATQQVFATTPLGMRLLAFDLLINNHDRSRANLLCAGATVHPIDHNVAFQAVAASLDRQVNRHVLNWFGIEAVVGIDGSVGGALLHEIARIGDLIDDGYLERVLSMVPSRFLDRHEGQEIKNWLRDRRDRLELTTARWWTWNIQPVVTHTA